MKLWLSIVLAFALVVACVSVPLRGRTVWGHAKDHGVPQATGRVVAAGARGIARGASAAWTWITARPEAGKAAPAAPARRAARRDETKPGRSVAATPHSRAASGGQDDQQPASGLAPEPPAAPAAHGILAEAPAERISAADKTALERLVAGSAKRK